MKKDELVPLKRVLAEVGVSRATLWRVRNSGIEGFPKPTIVRRRVHWKLHELAELEQALDAYAGRNSFDRKRKSDLARPEDRHRALSQMKKLGRRRRRSKSEEENSTRAQPDLFGDGVVVVSAKKGRG